MKYREHKKRLLSFLAFTAIAGVVVLVPSASARAADVGVRMGYYFDANAFSLGMEMLTPINDVSGDWYFNPNVEIAMERPPTWRR